MSDDVRAGLLLVTTLLAMIACAFVLVAHWPHPEEACPPVWECNNDPAINNPRCCP